jgi:hypothetical protein
MPPEQLLRALLLQVVYSIRSGRLLMEQLQYNLLFRCGDKNYDTEGVVATLRALDVTPHIAQKVKSTRVAAGSCRLTFPASVSAAFECPAVPTS